MPRLPPRCRTINPAPSSTPPPALRACCNPAAAPSQCPHARDQPASLSISTPEPQLRSCALASPTSCTAAEHPPTAALLTGSRNSTLVSTSTCQPPHTSPLRQQTDAWSDAKSNGNSDLSVVFSGLPNLHTDVIDLTMDSPQACTFPRSLHTNTAISHTNTLQHDFEPASPSGMSLAHVLDMASGLEEVETVDVPLVVCVQPPSPSCPASPVPIAQTCQCSSHGDVSTDAAADAPRSSTTDTGLESPYSRASMQEGAHCCSLMHAHTWDSASAEHTTASLNAFADALTPSPPSARRGKVCPARTTHTLCKLTASTVGLIILGNTG